MATKSQKPKSATKTDTKTKTKTKKPNGRRKKDGSLGSGKVHLTITAPLIFYTSLREIEAEDAGLETRPYYDSNNGSWEFKNKGMTPLINHAINEFLRIRGKAGYNPVLGVHLGSDLEQTISGMRRSKHYDQKDSDGVNYSASRNRLMQRALIEYLSAVHGLTPVDEDGDKIDFDMRMEDWNPTLLQQVRGMIDNQILEGINTPTELLVAATSWWVEQETAKQKRQQKRPQKRQQKRPQGLR